MDIKTAATDGQTRALAWLNANMTEEEPAKTDLPPVAETPVVVPPTNQPVVEQRPAETPGTPVVAKSGIADAIRRDREARATATSVQESDTKHKAEVESLKKEIEALKAAGATNDPFEYLKLRKMTKELQAQWGQAFLYDLRPEVAPQEFRLELYKAEQARQKEAERVAAEEQAAAEAQQNQMTHLNRYANEVGQYIQSSAGSNPESELWFTEDDASGKPVVNQRAYLQSLMATANNLTLRAQSTGQQVDLSPANIAKVLEQEVVRRMSRRDARKAQQAPATKTAAAGTKPPESGTQPTTTSGSGLRGGSPEPKDMSEAARKARAIEAGFGAGR